MRTLVFVGLAALALSTTVASLAQAQQQSRERDEAFELMIGAGDIREGGGRFGFTEADRTALFEARLAAMKIGLRLTEEQEKLWPAVDATLRDNFKVRAELMDKWRAVRRPATGTADPIFELRERAERATEIAALTRKLADALEPLYQSLDQAQKRRFAVLLPLGGARGTAARLGGWDDFDGDRGWRSEPPEGEPRR
jgi:zinc resistance-associated protein